MLCVKGTAGGGPAIHAARFAGTPTDSRAAHQRALHASQVAAAVHMPSERCLRVAARRDDLVGVGAVPGHAQGHVMRGLGLTAGDAIGDGDGDGKAPVPVGKWR